MNTFKKIFIIDDEAEIREMLKDVFRKKGYAVTTFSSPEMLLTRISTSSPDLIILDLLLPWEGGEQVLQKIKGIEKFSAIPVIIISGKKVTDEEIQELYRNGATSFFAKPFSPLALYQQIKEILGEE